ncbi:DUF5681 domain-containing protein [Sphingomonas sp. ASV193]|uniref:DUF5681 domain-containing protein n=1 Tax=Sphingomonas sp. ASV193 TaxID=3144405 RepID=UPI0032E89270
MVGYKDPPIWSRFPSGFSGNPKGRPKKTTDPAQSSVLDDEVGTFNGKPVTRRQFVINYALREANRSDTKQQKRKGEDLQRFILKQKRRVDAAADKIDYDSKLYMVHFPPRDPDAVDCLEDAAHVCGFGTKVQLGHPTARVMLESWVLNEAFERLGERRLSREEQRLVLLAARFPKAVKWPSWWDKDLRARPKGFRFEPAPGSIKPVEDDQEETISFCEFLRRSGAAKRKKKERLDRERERERRAKDPVYQYKQKIALNRQRSFDARMDALLDSIPEDQSDE